MQKKELYFLSKISNLLMQQISTPELSANLKEILKTSIDLSELNIYVYDSESATMRDCAKNWNIIDDELSENEKDKIYKAFEDIKGNDFLINHRAFCLPEAIGEACIKLNSLFIPIVKPNAVFGILELKFDNEISITTEALLVLKIIGAQISLKLQNIVLNEQSKINVDFHDSMKNIAKIIETQYELSYIVPIIGEMLDRFISDHLIYVFLKQEGKYKLVWPKACNDERIFEALKSLTPNVDFLLTHSDRIGVFPLISDDEISGCIVARSTLDSLSKRDIIYLEQLTKQASATINRANSYSKVLQYATLDALTNLNNRRQFEIRLGQEIATTKRQNNPLCAMMIDIDYFKKVNDTYGHASGDTVLKTVANIIKEHLRESDIPSRYGGEEFAILLPFTNIDEAQVVGERLRKAVEKQIIILGEQEIKVTISMGISEFKQDESGEQLFERADKALYDAKESGRNRVKIN